MPPVDGLNLWPRWVAHADALQAHGTPPPLAPRTLAIGSHALIDLRQTPEGPRAYKLVTSQQCECQGCRPCQPCNATGGCLFEVLGDPSERRELSAALPAVRRELLRLLAAARSTAWRDEDPLNLECWENPKSRPDYWLEYALEHGAVMQPWLGVQPLRAAKARHHHKASRKRGQ